MSSGNAEEDSRKKQAKVFLEEFLTRHYLHLGDVYGAINHAGAARGAARHFMGQLNDPAVRKALLEYLQE